MNETVTAYTISQTAKIIGVTAGTLRNWEKEFDEKHLHIHRYKEGPNQGARYYTDREIKVLKYIKSERNKNTSLLQIKEKLEQGQPTQLVVPGANQTAGNAVIPQSLRELIIAEIIDDVKNEVREEMKQERRDERREIMEELKKFTIEQKNYYDERDRKFFEKLDLVNEKQVEKVADKVEKQGFFSRITNLFRD